MSNAINYIPSVTAERFHADNSFVRGIMGPVGSGKSTACCMETMFRAHEQKKLRDGSRRTRFVFVRDTYRELEDTTLRTWMDWFGGIGNLNKNSMTWTMERGDVCTEIMFRALDRPDDIKKLLSLELTGGWINEARNTPKSIVDALTDRVGRYPAVKDGGCTWSGVFMDTNPPDDDHWWYRLSEVNRPDGWRFYKQPGGLVEIGGEFVPNPAAENIENIDGGHEYYVKRMEGKNSDYIRVYYCGEYGFVRSGKPVFPEYVDSVHCQDVGCVPGVPVYVGIDFGLTPAAVFGQRLVDGRWIWFDELVTEDMGISRFSDLLKAKINQDYQGFTIMIYGDPAGEQRAQTDEITPFMIMRAKGLAAQKAPTNDFTLRRESVAIPLSRLVDGKPGLIISPKCDVTRKGMAGAYGYKRIQVAGDERYRDMPDKNKYSHPVEAAGYMMIGAGEGKKLITPADVDSSNFRTVGNIMRMYARR